MSGSRSKKSGPSSFSEKRREERYQERKAKRKAAAKEHREYGRKPDPLTEGKSVGGTIKERRKSMHKRIKAMKGK